MRGGSAGSAERRRTEPGSGPPGDDAEYPSCRARGVVERPGGEKVQTGWPARVGQGRAQGEHHPEAGPGKAGRGGQVHGGQRVVDQVVPAQGRSAATPMPRSRSAAAGPMPERIKMAGLA